MYDFHFIAKGDFAENRIDGFWLFPILQVTKKKKKKKKKKKEYITVSVQVFFDFHLCFL